jgi:hypothetical protein
VKSKKSKKQEEVKRLPESSNRLCFSIKFVSRIKRVEGDKIEITSRIERV